MKGNCTYLPALLPKIFTEQVVKLGFERARKMFWWDEKAFFKHNSLLISAYYGMEKKDDEQTKFVRKFLQIPEDAKLYGDSGGFQSMTLRKVIPNEDIMDWYENNCDFAFVQDFPKKYIDFKNQEADTKQHLSRSDSFKMFAEFQAESNKEFMKRKFTKCKLYNIVHGNNVAQMDHWFDTVKNDKMFGWTSSIKPTDPFRVAFSLAHFFKKGVRENVHVFAASGFETIPLIIWATKYIDNITFDSSSWMAGNIYRAYCSPIDITKKLVIGNSSKGQYDKLPCDCPVCRNLKNTKKIYENNATAASLVSLHNLYWMLWYIERLKGMMQVESDFRGIVKMSFGTEVIQAMNYLDEAVVDFDKANTKYWEHLGPKRNLFQEKEDYSEMSMMNELIPPPEKKKRKKKEVQLKDLEEAL